MGAVVLLEESDEESVEALDVVYGCGTCVAL